MVAMMSSLRRFMQWLVFLLLTFMVSLALSWVMLATVDFVYPLLHDYAGLGANITKYAPQNSVRPYFDQTTKAERVRLFHGIVEGIHHQGQGLAELRYHDSSGQPVNTLLVEAEIVHLQDVANLLDKVKVAAVVALILWAGMFALLVHYRQALPGARQLVMGLLGLGAIIAVVLSLGAVEVFYQLHMWIFPAGHQWFFYYQQSLMSMMMKAPDLFGYIAAMQVVLAVFISVGLLWGYRRIVAFQTFIK
jgi:hypothetical protein